MDISKASDISKNPVAQILVNVLTESVGELGLEQANLYYDFPLYRDDEEGGVVATQLLLVSRRRGVFIIGTSDADDASVPQLRVENSRLEHVFSHVVSRLVKNRKLSKFSQLKVPMKSVLFVPGLTKHPELNLDITEVTWAEHQIKTLISSSSWDADQDLYIEAVSTIEGAKGLIRPTRREVDGLAPDTKGRAAAALEAEISVFDRRQKNVAIQQFTGPQRIRGLAGSGKTVVLAMRAALLHLRYPDATILYTYWTRHLQQHVRRLITRFYRQFDEVDPDWSKIRVMHGWGSNSAPGVYYNAAMDAGIPALNYQQASSLDRVRPFGAACAILLKETIKPAYDYVLIDEGQDYVIEFIQLCARLARDMKFVIAYDELQNIFQTAPPRAADVLGTDANGGALQEFEEDLLLKKCYRNPREILVCAHALGFGIYGRRIVQVLENEEHWEDVGYRVTDGDFTAGSPTIIERPPENSLTSISKMYDIEELVQARSFSSVQAEIEWVGNSIKAVLMEGLKPEDVLVITVDDRNAKAYLGGISVALANLKIRSHNVHGTMGDSDFNKDDSVTLSTVHKAKGNEAYVVYVVGVDALYPSPGVRHRNMLFTAMTRPKGWLRVTGLAPNADEFIAELRQAKTNFPSLVFNYPSPSQLTVMRHDLELSASKRAKAERLLEEIAEDLSTEEIEEILKRRQASETKSKKLRKRQEPK